jgi:hypothetical protein
MCNVKNLMVNNNVKTGNVILVNPDDECVFVIFLMDTSMSLLVRRLSADL